MPVKKDQNLPRGIYQRNPGSKIYHIQYTDSLGRRRRERAGTYKMAEDLLLRRQIDTLRRKLPGVLNKVGLRMNELIDDAIAYAQKNNDPVATADLESKLERIRDTFGEQQVIKVQRENIVAWLDEQADEREWKPASRNRYHSAFSLIFRVAIQNGKCEANPASGIPRKQEDNGRIRYLSREEEDRLVKIIEERYPKYLPIFMLSVHTGMRRSEQLRSEVGDYDAATGMLMVRQKKNRRGPAVRYVPLTPIAVRAYEAMCEGKQPGQPLCTNMQGDEMTTMRYWFEDCLERAGIEDYSWHSNRHTFCSRLVMAGVPLAVVSKYAGHSSAQTTMRYSHLIPDVNEMARQKMMSWYEGSAA